MDREVTMIRVESGLFLSYARRDTGGVIESVFDLLPEEMIMEIFRRAGKLRNIQLTCRKFRRIGWDTALFKEELAAMKTILQKWSQPIHVIDNKSHPVLRLNRFVGQCLNNLSLRELATFNIEDPIFNSAPYLKRYLISKYPVALREAIMKQLSSRENALTIDFTILAGNTPIFFNTLNSIDFTGELILRDMTSEGLLFFSAAIQEGRIKPTCISVYSSHDLDYIKTFQPFTEAILKSPSMRELVLKNIVLDGDKFLLLRVFLRENHTLDSITFGDVIIDEESIEILTEMLEEHPQVTHLTLERIFEDELRRIIPRLNRTHLTSLSISHSRFTEESLEYLAGQIASFTKLQELHLEGSKLDKLGIDHLRKVLPSEKPLTIHLPGLEEIKR